MEDEINAYRILLQRHLNDDRLLVERSSLFLASSSILFIGFVMLPPDAFVLRIILPSLGLLLSFLGLVGNKRTIKGLDYWEEKEKEIEEEGQSFAYMREKGIIPHAMYETINSGWFRWLSWIRNRHIYTYWLPSLFIALWICSLIWVVRS